MYVMIIIIINLMKINWIKKRIHSHWNNFGKVKTFVHRDFESKTVVIDFMNGGPCTLYTYEGKYIAG